MQLVLLVHRVSQEKMGRQACLVIEANRVTLEVLASLDLLV